MSDFKDFRCENIFPCSTSVWQPFSKRKTTKHNIKSYTPNKPPPNLGMPAQKKREKNRPKRSHERWNKLFKKVRKELLKFAQNMYRLFINREVNSFWLMEVLKVFTCPWWSMCSGGSPSFWAAAALHGSVAASPSALRNGFCCLRIPLSTASWAAGSFPSPV